MVKKRPELEQLASVFERAGEDHRVQQLQYALDIDDSFKIEGVKDSAWPYEHLTTVKSRKDCWLALFDYVNSPSYRNRHHVPDDEVHYHFYTMLERRASYY